MKNKKKWIARQQEIVNGARTAGRDLTAEEQAVFDKLQRQIDEADDGQGGEPAVIEGNDLPVPVGPGPAGPDLSLFQTAVMKAEIA